MAFPYRGTSMRGTFLPGDLLIVTPVALEDLQCGDVVAFQQPSARDDHPHQIVHRVRACTSAGLVTRGDQCLKVDQTAVTASDLIGRVLAVERDGQTRPVLGGWRGHARAAALRLWRRIAPAAGWPYRRVRASGLARALWRPSLAQIHLETETGPMIKYVHRQRTVARWWPAEGRFWCRKPYDLVLVRPEAEAGS
ncbi:MAG: hypothetical protein PVI59_13865 [Anaerolineae bacterium]